VMFLTQCGNEREILSILLGVLIGCMMPLIYANSKTQDLWYINLMSQKVFPVVSNDTTRKKEDWMGFQHLELPPMSSRRLCGRVAVENLPKLEKYNRKMLDPHRGVSNNIPTKGYWALWLGNPQPGYLGMVGGDRPSDEELKLKSQIRIALPTVPRSGNHWFSNLWREATGRSTGSIWSEGGVFDFDRVCSAYLEKPARLWPDCRNGDHVLVKSHTPFLPLDQNYLYDADYRNLSYAINTIRNPFDNHRAWAKYSKKKQPMQKFSYQWRAHHDFLESAGRMGLARYVLRYEDMLIDVEKEFRGALAAVPGRKFWTEEGLQGAIQSWPASYKFEEKCGESLGDLSHEEMVFMKEMFGGTMAKYGYFLEYEDLPT